MEKDSSLQSILCLIYIQVDIGREKKLKGISSPINSPEAKSKEKDSEKKQQKTINDMYLGHS